jgi:hypothetical protein
MHLTLFRLIAALPGSKINDLTGHRFFFCNCDRICHTALIACKSTNWGILKNRVELCGSGILPRSKKARRQP